MIKLMLSNPYDLTDLGANYNTSNLYLGYVKSKGFVLINETNDTVWFNCINSNTDPDRLSIDWQWEMEEIQAINKVLNKILMI